ncbi:hypothetical protein SFRURICE_021039 [Spodoptera frugiperda]|nr:hypothetical protein SFRURICE_021039 [Spodoptera frugiperda]
MPNNNRKSRSRSGSRELRHYRHDSRARESESHTGRRDVRSRHRGSQASSSPRRHTTPNNLLTQQMQQILDRLTTLEEQQRALPQAPCELIAAAVPRATPLPSQPPQRRVRVAETKTGTGEGASRRDSAAPPSPERSHGHKSSDCYKRLKPIFNNSKGGENSQKSNPAPSTTKLEPCSFCKKPGHRIESCFAKKKAESSNASNVNFCRENVDADSNDEEVEFTPERAATHDVHPRGEGMTEPVPGTSGATEPLRIQEEEDEDVLQSGEAVLEE